MTDNALKPCEWKLVPVDPTERMLDAGEFADLGCDIRNAMKNSYRAMIAVAPAPTQAASDQVERLKEAIYEIAKASGSFAGCQDDVYWRAEVAALMAEHGLTWEQASIRRQAAIAAMRDTKGGV